jgi:hypothetical protein
VRRRAALGLLAAAAVALPAAAYVLPATAILRRAAERRTALALVTVEATGTLQADGPSAGPVLAAGGVRRAGGLAALPARVLWRVPNRCRIELLPPDGAEADRPWLLVKDEAVSGSEALAREPAFVALARGLCTALALPQDPEAPDRPLGVAVARRGVALADASIGRFDGRVSWVLGGKPTELAKPLAWFDKESFQPTRLLWTEAGLPVDVRFLGWGSPTGGDWAPRAVEVHGGGALRLRFSTEKATANGKLPEALWQ